VNGLSAAIVIVVGIGWGLLAPGSKALFIAEPAVFNGASLAFARAGWALPVFMVVAAVLWARERPVLSARRWIALVLAGLCYGPGIALLISLASARTSIAHISFLIGVSPVTNAAVAAIVFRTTLDRRAWLALVLGIVGVVLLAMTHRSGGASIVGDALMIAWLAGFAAYACFLKYAGEGLSSTLIMSLVGVVSTVALMLVDITSGGVRALVHVFDSLAIAVWFFGIVVVWATIVSQVAYTVAIRRMGIANATIGAEYTTLAVGIVASLAMHEPWTPLTAAAGVCFAAALAVTFVANPFARRRSEVGL